MDHGDGRILPYVLPAAISLISCCIQAVVLVGKIRARQGVSMCRLNKMNIRITITIFYLTGLFVCCNSVYFISLIYLWTWQKGIASYLHWIIMVCHGSGVVTTFLNSALNPVIMIVRGKQLKAFIRGLILGDREETAYVVRNLAASKRGVKNVNATTNV